MDLLKARNIGTKNCLKKTINDLDRKMGASKSGPQKKDKVEVIKVLIIAVLSFVVGFALVIVFLRPSTAPAGDQQDEEEAESAGGQAISVSDEPAEEKIDAPSEQEGYAPAAAEPEPAADQGETGEAEEGSEPGQGEAPPEVPPGRTPDGVALDGDGFYLKCWDASGGEHSAEACDRLDVFEKRFSTRLYVVDKCRQKAAGDKAQGKLSLGVEIDFEKMALSYWNGASSDIDGAGKIATCLRSELAGLPIHGFDHKHERYRIFFTVVFGKGEAKTKAAPKEAEPKKPAGKGKMAEVTMDRVRVRKAPVDGEVIGKISTGNQVKLLERKGGWCKIVTPNGNEGWMTCDALKE